MSADNGYIIRQRANGKWIAQYINMSADDYPDLEVVGAPEFVSDADAINHVRDAAAQTEYGIHAILPFDEPTPEATKPLMTVPEWNALTEEERMTLLRPGDGGHIRMYNPGVEASEIYRQTKEAIDKAKTKAASPPPTTPSPIAIYEQDSEFGKELESILHGYSVGSRSGTQPFLLARLLLKTLKDYEDTVITQAFLDRKSVSVNLTAYEQYQAGIITREQWGDAEFGRGTRP